jgi:hypothetical protein
VLHRCHMTECSVVDTPLQTKSIISAFPDDPNTMHEMKIGGHWVSYRTVVGSLMYAMLGTRPDLAYVVGVLGRYSATPKEAH